MNENFEDSNNEIDLDVNSWNQLTVLGNKAIKLGKIAGHGYHQGKYEIIQAGKILVMTPTEAVEFLEKLITGFE